MKKKLLLLLSTVICLHAMEIDNIEKKVRITADISISTPQIKYQYRTEDGDEQITILAKDFTIESLKCNSDEQPRESITFKCEHAESTHSKELQAITPKERFDKTLEEIINQLRSVSKNS